jgi:hypothetical protein
VRLDAEKEEAAKERLALQIKLCNAGNSCDVQSGHAKLDMCRERCYMLHLHTLPPAAPAYVARCSTCMWRHVLHSCRALGACCW